MGAVSRMFVTHLDPERRLNQAPHGILPTTDTTAPGWRPAPTGYYPDHYADRMGRVRPKDPVLSPDRCVPLEPGNTFDRIDQHPYLQVDATWTPDEPSARPTGRHDPLTDGPPQPTVRMSQVYYHRAAGSSRTRFMDVPDGRRFSPTGTQDGVTTVWYQSAGAAMAPVNSDGTIPETRAQLGPGPVHGWTAIPVINAQAAELAKAKALVQMKNRGQGRRASSTFAGQTFSQRSAYVSNPAGANGPTPSWRTRG